MSIHNLLNQFMGSAESNDRVNANTGGITNSLGKLTGSLPGGLAGGAAAGSIMALMLSNKKGRKFAGKAAKYGGAAMLGGLAYKAFQSWQHNSDRGATIAMVSDTDNLADAMQQTDDSGPSKEHELRLVKTMVAAAKADGHIDAQEQQRIIDAVSEMGVTTEVHKLILELLNEQITVQDLALGVEDMKQKSELYLVSCLVIDQDHPAEKGHLDALAKALELPDGLAQQIRWQAEESLQQAA